MCKSPQCEACVPDPSDPHTTRRCKRAAAPGDRLCKTHILARQRVNTARYVITLSVKAWRFGKVHLIGKLFHSYEDAEMWARLNSSLIFARPGVKSYCIQNINEIWQLRRRTG